MNAVKIPSCTDVQEGSVQLVGGLSPYEGRVEVCNNGQWGTICNRGYWNYQDAMVVCRQLGFTTAGMYLQGASLYSLFFWIEYIPIDNCMGVTVHHIAHVCVSILHEPGNNNFSYSSVSLIPRLPNLFNVHEKEGEPGSNAMCMMKAHNYT